MKTIAVIYQGPLPEVHIEVGPGRHVEAVRGGKPVLLPENIATELLERGKDFIPAEQKR